MAHQNNISIIYNEKAEDSPDIATFVMMGLVQRHPDIIAFAPVKSRINVTAAATRTVFK